MLALLVLVLTALLAQGAQTERHIGVLKAVDAAAHQLVLSDDDGGDTRVSAVGAAVLRVAPGETDLSQAQPVALTDVKPGDRIMARGTRQNGVLMARSVVVMSRPDLDRKQNADRSEWKRHGISGRVTATNAASNELTITVPGSPQAETLVLRLAADASQRRYRAGSARFSDAAPSTLSEIRPGDQIHVLGERAGSVVTAKHIVSGSFRNFAGIVLTIDETHKNLAVRDLEQKKVVSVLMGPDSNLRRINQDGARKLGMASEKGNSHPPQTPADVRSTIERLPVIGISDLKAGDVVIVASQEPAQNAGQTTVLAITLLSGAEPLLTQSAAAQRTLLGSWNLNVDSSQP